MPNYRRNYVGSIFFLTLVTYGRRRLFDRPDARRLMRQGMAVTQRDRPWIAEGKGHHEQDWCGRLDLPGYTEYGWPE